MTRRCHFDKQRKFDTIFGNTLSAKQPFRHKTTRRQRKKRPWLKIVLTAVLFLITGMLTQFMSNTAAAALLCPIGLSIAESLGASPTAVVLAIGFSASAAYMTPVATPPNTMIYGPGGLQFMDYVKVGTPLFIIVMIMALVLMPIIWPFFPNA